MSPLSLTSIIQSAFPLGADAHWLTLTQRPDLPAGLMDWLTDSGSLTARLQANCSEFQVCVIGQNFSTASEQEQQALALSPHYSMTAEHLIREVLLCCDGEPWVYARTVIPASTLTGEEQKLAQLGEQPLGATLFNSPNMTREDLVIAALPESAKIVEAVKSVVSLPEVGLWGRRSLFHLANKPLLVHEIFLPSAMAYRPNHQDKKPTGE
ncbi:chorismate--pyruvate lyase family protein [Motilimonas sp. KMU-193]|uniref:chorismate--pyruvate lyase family protein n=1 Tax=Motilimonas sp. KMU-193 TaxID=3388668 RepID=UPI00396B147B